MFLPGLHGIQKAWIKKPCLAIVIRRKDVTAIYKKFELFKGEILFLNMAHYFRLK